MEARTRLRWSTALVLLLAAVFGPAAAVVRAPCAQATSASAAVVAAAEAGAQEQTPAALAPACNAPASLTVAVTVRATGDSARECCAWGDVAVPSSAPGDTPSRPPSLV